MKRRLLLGIGAAAVGGLGVGVGLPFVETETESGRDACMRGLPESTVTASVKGWSWSPIGTRCAAVDRDGTREDWVVPPWRGSR